MQPQRERVKLSRDRNWWRVLPVVGALGLIGLMLVLTFMPNRLDEAHIAVSAVALLSSPTPSMQAIPTMADSPFPTTLLSELPPSSDLPVRPELSVQPSVLALTVDPNSMPNDPMLLPTVVPVIDFPTATMPPPASATVPVVAQSPTPIPTSTSLPMVAEVVHSYALIHSTPNQSQLVRIEADQLIPIVTADKSARPLTLLLPKQQTLFIPRNQTLLAIDLLTGQPRWTYELLEKTINSSSKSLILDQAGTGIYLVYRNNQDRHWQWRHLAIHDGKTLTAPKQLNLSLGPFNITSDGKIWKVEKGTLVQFDPLTTTKRSFGLVKHPQIIGNGHHPLLAVLRTSTTLSLIDWATGNERQVPLNPPFQGGMTQASFSDDQRILLVRSIVPNSNELAKRDSLLSAYNLDNGTLIATRNIGDTSLFYPTLIADQWMIEQLDAHSEQSRLLRWNVATNQVIEVVGPVIWSKVRAAWMGEFTGAPINPVSIELQTAVTPRPLEVSYDRSSPLPTIEPPSTQPIVLLSERLGGGETLQRFNTDQSLEVLLEDFRYEFPRYNQPPLLLQRPTSDTWRLVDGATLQTVVWQFEAPINAETYIPIILDPTYQSMVAVVHKDLRKDDQFTEPTQLVQINTQTGAWNVLADSHTWQHLIGSAPIAWYGDTVYFNQWNEGKSIRLWRAQLGPPFQAEKIAEIPAIVANIPDVDSALQAKVYVSPNQRWLLYPLAAANKTMVLRALDVVNQRSHDIALPLMDINELSFSPDGNSFAFMLPTADRAAEYPALYQLEQQRWYQLDLSSNGYKHKLPFLWSPDGHWLLVKLSTKSQETLMAVYDAQQPSQVFRTELAFRTQPLALDNDGKTLLVTHFLQPNLEQRTWNGQAWQSDWRIDSPISNPEAISYLYPR